MAKTSNNVNRPSNNRMSNRPKPMIPKNGFTATRRRYGEGGRS